MVTKAVKLGRSSKELFFNLLQYSEIDSEHLTASDNELRTIVAEFEKARNAALIFTR